jgi:hypothetical protein
MVLTNQNTTESQNMTKSPSTSKRGLVSDYTFRIGLFLWKIYTNIRIYLQLAYTFIHCCRIVFISYDKSGPFIKLNGEVVYLKMSDAQPLKGIQIIDRYFTTIESNKAYTIEDDDF